ncbi:MAG: hypothetical protein COT34_02485 [Candidatus Nealsonbacteria bacterium CG08_land_8_20_14_0_20_43_11]|uniref:TIGR00725 family protein n=1 Tax=Candidatus Nealsonbacteria bacterium CG08_land_8_20_14_0_20_43_11 TaxID=1974706 RepID=A0A2M6T0E0_9BACT|nr:MAG: hypothetical protein COT34_02485 [Candidatus Nealsonbacteria bacterium CG08_land_8_20_14_0_20_43_11]
MENIQKIRQMKYKIAVSGAAQMNHCCQGIEELAKEVGREIARQKCVIITGATTGVPYFSALGAKETGGFSVGFSPATSENAHLKTYKLPIDAFDIMIYTGADYVGRNITMTKSADAVIIVCGRMGTFHEFATAFEIQKPIGVLERSGGTADKIRSLVEGPTRGAKRLIVYDKNPAELIKKIIKLIEKEKKNNRN